MSSAVPQEHRQVGEPVAAPRRAEVLAALSLAIDPGFGQPMEHMLCSAVRGRP